jgi:hypothetical protein
MATENDTPKKRSAADEEKLLLEIRERFDYAQDNWQDIRKEADTDMRFVAGDCWDAAERAKRNAAMRPVLSLDELGQYSDQIINDIRANPIAMKFDPTGHGASEAGASFYQDKARETEYRSHAQIAYTTAFQDALHRSFGWIRLNVKYESDRSDNQEIWIEEIADPNSVLPDPDWKRPDCSDMKYLFHFETWDRKEFIRKWPKAKITDFSGEVALSAPRWFKGETKVQVAEYWTIKTTQRELLLFLTPEGQPVRVFKDEVLEQVPPGSKFVKSLRMVDVPSVCQYVTNGVEILETNEWLGKYIPFVSCFGKVLYLDEGAGTVRKIMSLTRLGRDPQMLYCYYRTQQAEMAGMIPKAPVMGYEGQFRGHEVDWQRAAHEPVAFLEFRGTTEGTGAQLLPQPQRLDYHAGEHLQALELCAEGARRAIQAAMGSSPLPTSAQRRNEKSGIALKQIESSAQKGSFHFKDHYQDLIRRAGVIFEDLVDKIYDTARDTGVRRADETAATVRINDPDSKDGQGQPNAVSTKGDYLVTVSTGPNTESTREAAKDYLLELAQNPVVFPLVAAEITRLQNLGAQGDEIADLLEALKPPELRKPKDGSPPLPPEAQQAMAENAQLKEQLQQAVQQIETDQAKQQATIEKTKIDATVKLEQAKQEAELAIELQRMKDATAIRIAELAAEVKGLEIAHSMEHEAQALSQQQATDAHTAEQADLTRQHEASMAERAAALSERTAERSERAAQRPTVKKTVKRDAQNQISEVVVEQV